MKTGLVVEDQLPLARWLTQVLEESFEGIRVTHAGSVAAGEKAIAALPPDIALVDLGLPDGSGVDLIRLLAIRVPECQVIVSTVYADDAHLFPALRAGAQGYLLKDQPKDKVIQALRGIAAGEPPLSASIARRLLRAFGDPAEQGRESAKGRGLSPRERETLSLIARGFKIAEVAATLEVSRHTAHEYVKSVYRKLKVSSRAQATLEATRLGLVDPHR